VFGPVGLLVVLDCEFGGIDVPVVGGGPAAVRVGLDTDVEGDPPVPG
jgi:hypothetical protein